MTSSATIRFHPAGTAVGGGVRAGKIRRHGGNLASGPRADTAALIAGAFALMALTATALALPLESVAGEVGAVAARSGPGLLDIALRLVGVGIFVAAVAVVLRVDRSEIRRLAELERRSEERSHRTTVASMETHAG